MSTKTKSKYTVGVYCYGQKQWGSDAVYDRMTNAPLIVAVAPDEETAQEWIAEQMARQSRETKLQPGHGYHELYATIDLDTPQAYMSKQNAARDYCNIGVRKLAIIESPDVVKL